jgi:hypothetical protein
MKRFALAALLLAAACGSHETVETKIARLRNEMPASCTAAKQAQCAPQPKEAACPDGREPVIDYSADCCAHLTCQPICQPEGPCPVGPAPICPAGSTLSILTASDCCPAYRCDANGGGGETCDATGVCPVGQHCEMTCAVECSAGLADKECGQAQCAGICVGDTPTCQNNGECAPGEQCIIAPCMCAPNSECPPCAPEGFCVPIQPTCRSNADCAAGEECLLACESGGCAPSDPTISWRPDDCVSSDPVECVGVCVAAYPGCQTDADCPFGQCVLACAKGLCDPSSPDDCNTQPECFGQCMDVPPYPVCETNADCPDGMICPISPDCSTGSECDSQGNCKESACIAQCVPACNERPDACPMPEPMPCPYPGAVLVTGADCCPVWQCVPPTDPDYPEPIRCDASLPCPGDAFCIEGVCAWPRSGRV